jgi:two-component system sensor histidine kinase/response regulator
VQENLLDACTFLLYDYVRFLKGIHKALRKNTMIKILIVDDDVQVTTLLRKYLSPKRTEVVSVNESSKAMQVANSMCPDLFILDLMMPPPDGFELCRMIRADPNFSQTPILIITAMDISNSKATSFGANDYLTKPFNLDEIVDKINHLLNGDDE